MAQANRSHNGAIVIRPVANGFQVAPDQHRDNYVGEENINVFQSIAELHAWLDDHFDYRQPDDILADKPTGS